MKAPPDAKLLKAFSDEALMDELSRRSHERREREAFIYCDHCAHFKVWAQPGRAHLPMPESYNPCEKGHKMQFMTPAEIGDDYGFYRNGCRDRVWIGSEAIE